MEEYELVGRHGTVSESGVDLDHYVESAMRLRETRRMRKRDDGGLSISDLHVHADSGVALFHGAVNLASPLGSCVALMGPSGSGEQAAASSS